MHNIKIKLLLSAAWITFLFSCKNKEENSYKTDTADAVSIAMKEVVSALNLDNGKNFRLDDCDNVLVIPIDEGCESCLQKAISRSLNMPTKHLLVIISSASKKVFTQKIKNYAPDDSALLSSRNSILIDSSNLCFKKGLSDIMPRIYRMKNGKTQKQIMLDASDIDTELKSL